MVDEVKDGAAAPEMTDAERQAAADAETQAKLKAMEEEENAVAAAEAAKVPPPLNVTVAAIDAALRRELPDALKGGSTCEDFSGTEFDRAYAGVPNGTYRKEGSDLLLSFKGGRLKSATIASKANKWGGEKVHPV